MKRLALALLAIGLALNVAGCGKTLQDFQTGMQVVNAVGNATVPAEAALAARSSFNTMQIWATNYMELPRCNGSNGPICRDPALRERIDGAVRSGRAARNRIAAYMRANPGKDIPVIDYNTMVTATEIVKDLTAAYRAARGQP